VTVATLATRQPISATTDKEVESASLLQEKFGNSRPVGVAVGQVLGADGKKELTYIGEKNWWVRLPKLPSKNRTKAVSTCAKTKIFV